MKWYHYVAAFFAGMFLANAVPHFVNGISGNPFPTPFADPPGQGLSAPIVNIIWGLFNITVGYLLFRYGKISHRNKLPLVIFFLGIITISIMLSIAFSDKATM
ncbi:MAG: hypothetical protein PWQ06_1234 [Anaerophaga sp.]|nr:hypothetical protein [Anaerophaga sp.]